MQASTFYVLFSLADGRTGTSIVSKQTKQSQIIQELKNGTFFEVVLKDAGDIKARDVQDYKLYEFNGAPKRSSIVQVRNDAFYRNKSQMMCLSTLRTQIYDVELSDVVDKMVHNWMNPKNDEWTVRVYDKDFISGKRSTATKEPSVTLPTFSEVKFADAKVGSCICVEFTGKLVGTKGPNGEFIVASFSQDQVVVQL